MRTWCLAVACVLAGCGNDYQVPGRDGGGDGGGGPCSALTAAQCAQDSRCKVIPGCCGGPSMCVGKNDPAIACSCPAPCNILGEAACKTRTDCRADYCTLCSCTPTYQGCSEAATRPPPCPLVECPQPICPDGCRSTSDCGGLAGGYCASPGAPICGGACMVGDPCADDAKCASDFGVGYVCDYPACNCNGDRTCVFGCNSNADCDEGETCSAAHRCVAMLCTQGQTCPPQFDCVPTGPTELCRRRSCTSDGQCSGGFCVNGSCFKQLGTCELPRP